MCGSNSLSLTLYAVDKGERRDMKQLCDVKCFRTSKKCLYLVCLIVPLLLFAPMHLVYRYTTTTISGSKTHTVGGEGYTEFALKQHFSNGNKSPRTDKQTIRETFLLRRQHLRETCLNFSFPSVRYEVHRYFGAKLYNLTYCSVHKLSSTVMAEVFYILNVHQNTSEAIRSEVGSFFDIRKGPFWGRLPREMRTSLENSFNAKAVIMIIRNPYNRLFSGYMDRKSANSELGRDKNGFKCPTHTGFEAFLTGMMDQFKKNASSVNQHYAPLNWQCFPCLYNNNLFIVEMENFEDEISILLQDIGIKRETLTVAHEAFDFEMFRARMPEVVEYRLTNFLNMKTQCVSPLEVAKRFWFKLQTEGLIHMNNEFPDVVFNETNPSNVANILKSGMKKNPLTKSEAKQQRLEAIQKAYSTVPKEIIEQIQRFYFADFMLFNYDMNIFDKN